MKKQWAISNLTGVALVFAVSFVSVSATSGATSLCMDLRGFSLRSVPWPNAVERLLLDGVPYPNPAVERYFNLDIDRDDVNDAIEKSCPANPESRADPCMLTLKLSSSGKALEFNAWGFQLFRYHGQIFIVANADETRKKTNIFRIEKTGFKLVCENL